MGWLTNRRRIDLLLASLLCISAILYHTVVGFSLCIIGGSAYLFLLIRGKLNRNAALVSGASGGLGALALSLCLCIPYLYTILSFKDKGGEFPLTFNTGFLWTVLAAGALPIFLTALRFKRERSMQEKEYYLIAVLAAALLLGSFARMPLGNANKFVYPVFLVLIVLAGDGVCLLPGLFQRAKLLNALIIAGLAVSGAATIAFGLWGYVLDSGADIPVPVSGGRVVLAEPAGDGYRWIRENTPGESIFLNSGRRDITVLGPRRQLWTEGNFAIAWGYDDAEIEWRHKIISGLYSDRLPDDKALGRLRAFGAPVYLVLRPEDVNKDRLEEEGSLLYEHYSQVFENSEFTIVEIIPGI